MSDYDWVKLGDVCEIVGGGTPRRNTPEYFGGTIPWATPTDVTALEGKYIAHTRETITDEGLRKSSAKLVPAGTVLMTSRATIGFTAIAEVELATNQGFANFICGNRVLPEFLAAWLPFRREHLLQLSSGTTFKEISKGNLKKLSIPLPPLEEQRRIVDVLNRAASIERLRATASTHLCDFIPALFTRMFGDPMDNPMGWPVATLADIADEFRYGTSRKSHEGTTEHTTPILRIPNVIGGVINWDGLKHTELDAKELARLILKPGDILFVRTNGNPDYIGRCAVYEGDEVAAYASYLIRLRLKRVSPLAPTIIAHAMALPSVRSKLLTLARTTAGNYNINIESLGSICVPVPPKDLQARYLSVMSAANEKAQLATRADAMAKDLSASLLDKLLGGDHG